MNLKRYEEDCSDTSKRMRFGFFEVPAHFHTFDESLAPCARRSNSTALSRGKLLRCRHAVKTDCMKNKLRFGFFVVGSPNGYVKARIRTENTDFVLTTAARYYDCSVSRCLRDNVRRLSETVLSPLCLLLVPEMLATSSATEPLLFR